MAAITLVQLVTPNIDEYAKYSVASARNYALRHGYSFVVQRSKTISDLHINWTKIDLLREALALSAHDAWVVLLDADTIILDSNRTIEWFIEQFGKQKTAIFMAADTPFRIDFKKKPNAGFIIVKNNEIGRNIIHRWMEAAVTDGKQYNDTHPRNQLVYWNCVEPEYKDYQVVLPRRFFHKPLWWVPAPLKSDRFLFHITSTGRATRADYMKALYLKHAGSTNNLTETEEILTKEKKGLISVV